MSAYTSFYFRPRGGEQVIASAELDLTAASTVCGSVRTHERLPVEGAVALLFHGGGQAGGSVAEEELPIAIFVTGKDGRFYFGPLSSGEAYVVKVFKNHIKLRELEIIAD